MRSKKIKSDKRLKRAIKRSLDFKAKSAIFLIAGLTCDDCQYNSKNDFDEKISNTNWSAKNTWSSSYSSGIKNERKKSDPYCMRYMRPYAFPRDRVCHMFEVKDESD